MKFFLRFLIFVSIPAFVCSEAFAKAYFSRKAEMVEKADVIAVVEIKDLRSLEPDKRFGDQQAKLIPIRVLKGDLAEGEEVQIPCFFPCAVVKLEPGKYLVFLTRNAEAEEGEVATLRGSTGICLTGRSPMAPWTGTLETRRLHWSRRDWMWF